MLLLTRFAGAVLGAVRDGAGICRRLYPLMIPLVVIIKVLSACDLIRYLAMPLAPLMTLMGLPPDLGIAWAAGLVVHQYSALIVLAALLPGMEPLTVAQMSTFGLLLLIAHSLPIEGRIARECGVSFTGQACVRVAVALASGMALHLTCAATGWLQEPARMIFSAAPDPSLAAWALGELKNFVMIFIIISALMLVQRGIDHFNISRQMERALTPFLVLLGVSPRAATTILIGMTMGLIYGSGLIIRAARDGSLDRRDVFGSVTLIGLAHAIIEDTLLLTAAGGNWFVLLVVRSAIALCAGAVIIRLRAALRPFAPPG